MTIIILFVDNKWMAWDTFNWNGVNAEPLRFCSATCTSKARGCPPLEKYKHDYTNSNDRSGMEYAEDAHSEWPVENMSVQVNEVHWAWRIAVIPDYLWQSNPETGKNWQKKGDYFRAVGILQWVLHQKTNTYLSVNITGVHKHPLKYVWTQTELLILHC